MEKIIKKADIYLHDSEMDITISIKIDFDAFKAMTKVAEILNKFNNNVFENGYTIESIYFREEKINAEN